MPCHREQASFSSDEAISLWVTGDCHREYSWRCFAAAQGDKICVVSVDGQGGGIDAAGAGQLLHSLVAGLFRALSAGS